MANLTLGRLIEWLSQQDGTAEVVNGFSTPHSDRGDYADLAFRPVEKTTFSAMLIHAQSALGKAFYGYKGGEYVMNEYTDVLIGEWGECGENITDTHLKFWTAQQQGAADGR